MHPLGRPVLAHFSVSESLRLVGTGPPGWKIYTARGSKFLLNQDEFVNLLNRWKGSALNLVLTIFLPEVTTMLTIVIDKVELPTVTVALERSEKLSRDTIDVHFKGCVLERFEGDEGVGTVVRASWLSRTRREVLLAETT